jgi:hypothetical protein
MAETTADVRRDIELTRERMSTTLQQLEQKLNIMQVVRDNPWPAIALAVGAGVLLSGSRTDVKAAAATVAATRGASSRVGSVLDDVVANLMSGLHEAFDTRVTSLVDDLKSAIGAPTGQQTDRAPSTDGPPRSREGTADMFDRGRAPDSGSIGIQATRAD